MNEREMIEQSVAAQGLSIERWDEEHENGLTAFIKGKWIVAHDDYAEQGFYVDCEGIVTVCVVGAVEYRNQRVSWTFIEEGMDGGNDIPENGDVFSVLEPVD